MSAPIVKTDSSSRPRLLIFFGSPRTQGHTARLLDEFLSALPTGQWDMTRVDVYQKQVSPCIHCGDCERAPSCRFDDMDDIDQLLRNADRLIFAAPVYCYGFPSPMKALLDRFQRYYAARFSLNLRPPILRVKRAVLLTVSGSPETSGAQGMKQALARQFTVMNTTLVGHFHLPDTDHRTEITPEERAQLTLLAEDFTNSLK